MPARILMTADTVGGVWTFALDLAEGLARHGVRTVLASMGGMPSAAQQHQAARVPDLVLHASEFKLEWMRAPWSDVARAGDWLLELERRHAPDLVHLNNYCHGALPWRSPRLIVGHSCVLSWWEAVRGESAPATYATYRREVRRGLAGVERVIAPSISMHRALHRHYGSLPPLTVIHNGRPARGGALMRKQPLMLSVGRLWDAAKNIEAVLAVAPALRWPLYLIGELRHPNGGRVSVGGVHALGPLAPEPLADWYARAAVYVLPARYEPFGLSVLEAALSGCALVLGDIPSLRELWDDAAVFVPPEDRAALGRALETLTRDPRRRAELAQRARQRARRYSQRRMSAAYLDVYRELLGLALATVRPTLAAAGSTGSP